jgi:8-oxo-dGTP pyrophosphatase MutT (NUDIX family)
MEGLIPGIRNAVRAFIVRDNAVLVQHKVYEDGTERYVLPGGAPHSGETLIEGLQRECMEEIGCKVDVAELLYLADFFKARDTIPPTTRQQVEFIFRCNISETYVAQNGKHPDKHQKNVIWLQLSEINNEPFFPRSMSKTLSENPPHAPVYLGLIS